ncbi:MAG: DUF2156 domain-containing protein [Clostridia bacterium]|nr:DUF2156 domain-containing protein [Clostridia bacterium]
MIETHAANRIDFAHITLQDRELYESYLAQEGERGCEFSFANLYLWGRQKFAVVHGHIVLFSQFDRRSVYPWPLGHGDKKAVLDCILEDAQIRGIPCRITGLGEQEQQLLHQLYPGRFCYHCDEASFDYVYDIHDLADLPGKKYHGKRNHLNRFRQAYPHYSVLPLSESTAPLARQMLAQWYETKLRQNPDADFLMEKAALEKALRDFAALEMEGLLLMNGEEVLGFTMASRLSPDTFDVHFEKARADVQGAYPAINCEFARYLRDKYPEVRFLDREEDMGLEGLRRAKRSYCPHHMIKKCWACLLEEGYDC